MARKLVLIFLLLLTGYGAFTSSPRRRHRVVPQLSSQARFYLLTCDPGTELYSAFGHSAVRLYDPVNGLDQAYNYGVFNFNTPNFYLKFAQGQLEYQLAVQSYPSFVYAYERDNRQVISQELNLDSLTQQKLYRLLEENYLEANRSYKYDFFFDNCSSRIRDIIEKATDQKVVWQPRTEGDVRTFRDLIQPYIENLEWADYGIDIGLGLPCDVEANERDYMFLPDYLLEGFRNAKLDDQPLVAAEGVVVLSNGESATGDGFTPSLLNWLIFLFFAGLTAFQLVRKKPRYGWDLVLFLLLGLVGVSVLLLWFATDHGATQGNLNFLWAMPLHIVAAFMMVRKKKPGWLKKYFLAIAVLNLLLLISWPIFPQCYHTAFIPLMLAAALRGGHFWWNERKPSVSH